MQIILEEDHISLKAQVHIIRSMAVRNYNQYEMTVITATVSETAVIGEDYTTPLLENTQWVNVYVTLCIAKHIHS